MLRSLMLAVAVALALTMPPGPGDEQKSQEDRKEQGIKAEVSGTLRFESGHGYFIAVWPADKAEQEMRVWLRISENKELVRKLQGLDGNEVIARGKLAQLPRGHHANIPPLGMYMSRFEIEAAGAR